MSLLLRDLTFSYGQSRAPIFANLSIDFPSGKTTSITGSSGSGKSTLLYLVGLLLRPESGQVIDNGIVVSDLPDGEKSSWRANRVGFIFQDALLDPSQTILDNVCEGVFYAKGYSKSIEQKARDLLERVGVVSRFDHRPGEISGGQAQRVALCRALLKEPAIVLADEPTGNLDEVSASLIWKMLQDTADHGATVLVATHDWSRADSCDMRIHV